MSANDYPSFGPTVDLRPGVSLLEASAGTGKTWSITSILLRMVVLHGVPIEKILVVTFTRAATAELRERIREALVELAREMDRVRAGGELPEDPRARAVLEELSSSEEGSKLGKKRLMTAIRNFDQACISTIHGFCQQTLSASILEADASIDVELVDTVRPLIRELVDDYWQERLQSAEPEWIHRLAENGISRDLLFEIAREMEQSPDMPLHSSLVETGETANGEEDALDTALVRFRTAWMAEAEQATEWLIEQCRNKRLLQGAKPNYNSRQPKTQARNLSTWLELFDTNQAPTDRLPPCVSYFSGRRISPLLVDGTQLPNLDIFSAADRLIAANHAPSLRFVHDLVDRLRERLPRIKTERGQLSFTDLLGLVRKALRDPSTRNQLQSRLRSRFHVALIDEFQDTDPVQWEVFSALFGTSDTETEHTLPATLALIGDPKQAIYAFRGADLRTYLRAARQSDTRFGLGTNYRSDARLVRAVNQIFDQPQVFGNLDMQYRVVDSPDHLDADRIRHPDGIEPPLRLLVPDFEAIRNEGGIWREGITSNWANRRLGTWIVEDIVRFLDSGREILDNEEWRRVRPGDLAVLVRTNDQAQSMCRALLHAGVPAVSSNEDSVFDSPLAESLEQLMTAILRPQDTRPARTVLTGPLVSMSMAELDEIDEDRWEIWFERFFRWGEFWKKEGFMQAFRHICRDIDVLGHLLARPAGERAMTDIRHLSELLYAAERDLGLSPTALLRWLNDQRLDPQRRETGRGKQRLESDSDAVEVMTIHKSKGLEFGVVWIPRLWSGRSPSKTNKCLRIHSPEHEGKRILSLSLDRQLAPRPEHEAIAHAEELRESMRLAYVALTRAKHHCRVVCGRFGGIENSALGNLLHAGPHAATASDRFRLVRNRIKGLDHSLLVTELEELVQLSENRIGLQTLGPPNRTTRWTPPRTEDLAPLRIAKNERKSFDRSWSRGSYSSLVRGHHASSSTESPRAEGIDHDDIGTEEDGAPDLLRSGSSHLPLAKFPRGSRAGTFLHEVLENHDFAEPDGLPVLVEEYLGLHGFEAHWKDELCQGLHAALDTPLGPETGNLRLRELRWKPRERLDELDFDLPVLGGTNCREPGSIGGRELARVLGEYSEGCPLLRPDSLSRIAQLPGVPLRGYLTGQIDLVFRKEGQEKWFVADYKSNWLGDPRTGDCRIGDYRHERLVTAMDKSLYVLQYHLYTLALHRYLRWRIPDYEYERHMGGSLYLFLRGMSGPLSPVDSRGHAHGVFFDRPPRDRIEALDHLLAGRP